jgi:1-hydroxycarotenoid 3,4-desaturase
MSPRHSQRVIVVGAGVGGLVAALQLAAQGIEVLVLERQASPGGKMREVAVDGQRLDAGPTVLTMRWVFDELFDAVGSRTADHLGLRPLSVLARHAWSATERLDLHADVDAAAAAIGEFAGAAAARGYREFCVRAQGIYRTLEQPFLRQTRPDPLSLTRHVGLRGLPELMRIAPFATLWRTLGTYFDDPRLRQLFARYATYCGSSPFLAPATLMLVAHVERSGVWSVDGGMHRIAQALAAAAAARGATLRYGSHVERIELNAGRVTGVRLGSGEHLAATAVVFNGDAAALAAGALGQDASRGIAPIDAAQRSLSAVTWSLVAPTEGFELLRHNVFFGADYAAEFDALRAGRLPDDPTVYVCAQDRQQADEPPRRERLLVLVNAPPNADSRALTAEEIEACEQRSLRKLALCGLTMQRRPGATLTTTPTDFARQFPATGGALYGQASHGWQAAFRRPGARTAIPGLYLAGGSTHPGPGVPMAALSGRLAATSLMADRASTRRLHPAATPGGTSTR